MSAPLVQPTQASVELPLDDYGRALVSYLGTGTVTWDDGSSNALTFNAAQFPDGLIVVLGHYANDNVSDARDEGRVGLPARLQWQPDCSYDASVEHCEGVLAVGSTSR